MTTPDEQLQLRFREVADDASWSSDEQALVRLHAAAGRPRPRVTRLALATGAVAALAVVAGFLLLRTSPGDDHRTLDAGNAPVTTEGPQPSLPTTVPAGGTGQPFAASTSGRDMVVIDRDRSRVVVYFADGRPPYRYEPGGPLEHASVDASGRLLWLTRAATPTDVTALELIDPETGAVRERIEGAGFAAVSPDGTRMAFARVSSYGGYDQAVVLRDLATGAQRVVPGDRAREDRAFVGAVGPLTWSPDGRRLLVDEGWEDDAAWVVPIDTVTTLAEGTSLGVEGASWLSNDRLLATAYCCYSPDGGAQKPRHLVEVDVRSNTPQVTDRRERAYPLTAAPPVDGRAKAVYLDPDRVLRRLADGSVIATDVTALSW